MPEAARPECAILLVDDERDLLDLFAMALKRLGCEVHEAEGGQQALDILATLTPNVIVLDLAMPEVSGIEVLHAIRGQARFSATYIIVLTAVPVMLEREDAALAGMILTKPITPRALEQTIRKILGK